jgi:hypothetical protein
MAASLKSAGSAIWPTRIDAIGMKIGFGPKKREGLRSYVLQ